VATTNAISFISNGILWAACEGLAIPTVKRAKYALPSGILAAEIMKMKRMLLEMTMALQGEKELAASRE
jgi:hypothetical protein